MSTVLITGATSGIGRAACKLFAQRGGQATKIVAVGRRENLLAEVRSVDYTTNARWRTPLPPIPSPHNDSRHHHGHAYLRNCGQQPQNEIFTTTTREGGQRD